jgi:hypothetical protein
MKEVTDIQAKAEADAGAVRIVIPLEITVRIGDSGAAVNDVSAGALSPPVQPLSLRNQDCPRRRRQR